MKIFHNMKHLKGKTFDRSGLVIELALLVILVVFACSTLLVSAVIVGGQRASVQGGELTRLATVDELAERLLVDPDTDAEELLASDDRFPGYTWEWECDEMQVGESSPIVNYAKRFQATLRIFYEGVPALTVELYVDFKSNKTDVLFTVVDWTYHET
jgi:hypothetical protein